MAREEVPLTLLPVSRLQTNEFAFNDVFEPASWTIRYNRDLLDLKDFLHLFSSIYIPSHFPASRSPTEASHPALLFTTQKMVSPVIMETEMYDLAWISTINPAKAPYSDRINRWQWDMSKANIALMHAKGRTKPEILDMLRADGFMPSYKQLRTQMDQWGLNSSNRGQLREGVLLTTVEDTEVSDSEPESSTEGPEISLESINLKPTSSEISVTESPAVFGWSSFAAHSIPSCNQSASCASVDDAQSDGESIVSRQTFATHPSDNSSLRELRQDAKRLREIRKAEAVAHWQALADAGLLTEAQRSHVYKPILIRLPKYECHLCKQVNSKPRRNGYTCKRCHHKRCYGCVDWPKPQKSPGKIGSETCEINHSESFIADAPSTIDETPEDDVEVLFGVKLTGGPDCEKLHSEEAG